PRPAERAAAELVGQRLTRDLVTRVADLAAGPSKPLDNTDFTHPYRKRVTRELIARVADLAAGPAKPLDNTDFTHPYRKKVTRVFVARALAAVAGLRDGGAASEEVA
ncbi:MAG TPA: hypothetical protein VN977_03670, partial [Candidatus Binatia bacterium]|nr:hypothetical protein [Candidatus Binatia bacterium]